MSIGKNVASATFLLTASNASVRILSLITMPILTRLLPPDAYGTATIIGTAISLVSVFALAGLDMSYARSYYKKDTSGNESIEAFTWKLSIISSLILGLTSSIVWWIFSEQKINLPRYLALIVGIGVMLSVANTMSVTRARLKNKYKQISISIFATAITTATISIGTSFYWRQDELPLILSIIIGYLTSLLILGWPGIRVITRRTQLTPHEQMGIIKVGIAGILTAPAYWVISSLDRWFLGYIEDIASVGIYSIGYTVGIMGMILNNSIHSVWLPEASKSFEADQEKSSIELGRLMGSLIILMAIIWLAITSAGGDIIRLLAGPNFHASTELVPYIAGAVFFHGLLHLSNAGTLLKRKLHYTLPWWISGALICVTFNLLLIPILGRLGAAITQTISFAYIALGIFYSSQKLFPLQLNGFKLIITLLCIITIGAGMHPSWADSPWFSLMLKLPIGLIAAFFSIRLNSPSMLSNIAAKLNSKKFS